MVFKKSEINIAPKKKDIISFHSRSFILFFLLPLGKFILYNVFELGMIKNFKTFEAIDDQRGEKGLPLDDNIEEIKICLFKTIYSSF